MIRINAHRFPIFGALLIALLCFASIQGVRAQCYGYSRVYANGVEDDSNVAASLNPLLINADVSNKNNAVGNNLTDFSTINVSSLGYDRFLRLKFPKTFTGGESIHVKLSNTIDFSVFPVTIEAQAYSAGNPVGTKITLSTAPFTNILSGENITDLLIPSPGSSYDAVQVKITGGLAASGHINFYAAYVNELVTTQIDCNTTADVIYGITSGILGGLNTISNPYNVADNDLTTYASLHQNLGAAGYVHVTSILPAPSISGDLVSVTLQIPGTPVIGADLFTDVTVIAYLGNTVVATIPANDAMINVRLLDPINHIYQFTYPVTGSFDRISVQAGGLATALAEVYVYDIRKLVPTPTVKIDGVLGTTKSFCGTGNATLVIDPTQTCTSYKWYDAAVGGTVLTSGTTYTTGNLSVGTYHFYAEAIRDNCTSTVSERAAITIVVNPLPTITLGTDPEICIGSTIAQLPFTATTETPTTYSITWITPGLDAVTNAAFPASSPISIPIKVGATAGTYNGTITIKNANTCESTAVGFNVIIKPKPATPTVAISAN